MIEDLLKRQKAILAKAKEEREKKDLQTQAGPVIPLPDKVNLSQPVGKSFPSYGIEYADSLGWKCCNFLLEALRHRRAGRKSLSYREADIAARSKIDLNSHLMLPSNLSMMDTIVTEELSVEELLITEDNPGLPDSIYELRRMWNRGITYFKEKRYENIFELEKRNAAMEKGKAMMRNIEALLNKCMLPLWPGEYLNGFHESLTRPEYMDEEPYQEYVKKVKVLIGKG